jgi:hypothetical protein
MVLLYLDTIQNARCERSLTQEAAMQSKVSGYSLFPVIAGQELHTFAVYCTSDVLSCCTSAVYSVCVQTDLAV